MAEETDPPSSPAIRVWKNPKSHTDGDKAAPSAKIGASRRLVRIIVRRPTRSARRASSIEPKAETDIQAKSRASAGWLRWKLLAIQGEAIPETDSV